MELFDTDIIYFVGLNQYQQRALSTALNPVTSLSSLSIKE